METARAPFIACDDRLSRRRAPPREPQVPLKWLLKTALPCPVFGSRLF